MKLSRLFSIYLIVTGIIIVLTIVSYALRLSPASPINLGITTISLLVIGTVLAIGVSWMAYKSWRSPIFYEWLQAFSNRIRGFWGILLLIASGLLIGGLVFVSQIYASFRPIFIWSILSLGFAMLMLIYFASEEWKYLFISIFAFIIESVLFYLIQIFLFPLENYWISILSVFFCYLLIEWVLIKKKCIPKDFTDFGKEGKNSYHILFVLISNLIISAILSIIQRWMIIFIFPIFLLLCIIHPCITSIASTILDNLENVRRFNDNKKNVVWIISIFFASLIYFIAFLSPNNFFTASYPLLEGGEATKGIWFTIPVEKSELFPLGYARFEDSLIDDLGKVFLATLGQTLGLVEKCDFPGPDKSLAYISTNPMVQPKYSYTTNSMCVRWTDSLPSFFWRIGIIGLFLLSLTIGIFIVKDPIDFFLISILFLFEWFIWPASDITRVGNVAVLISGMAFIGLIFPLFRRNKFYLIIIWGLLSGFLFGLAGFVRQPSGYALTVTAFITIIVAGFQQKKLFIPFFAFTSILIGSNIIPATTNGLFLYRDEKLSITAPNISPRQHGAGFALLGGVGGRNPRYENSIDIIFDDVPIWLDLYNENPMINFSQNSYELMQKTGERLFFQYIMNNPMEFFLITVNKAYNSFLLMLKVPRELPFLAFLICIATCLRELLFKFGFSRSPVSIKKVNEILFSFVVLIMISSLPGILTSPEYGEATFLPASVMVFTAIFLVYIVLGLLIHKKAR
jgi:hypothetical protein